MKKVIIVIALLVLAAYAEYRYIMVNIHPIMIDDNLLQLEVFGQVDEYFILEEK